MRKLATIRRVDKLLPIEKADRIELAVIDGWTCVVGKGEFKVGDCGVYFEVDSFLPIEPRYEFLRSRCLKTLRGNKGFRLKTMRMRGVLSQGLLMPMKHFPEILRYDAGDDVTELLHVELWLPKAEIHMSGTMKGNFPIFIQKTDQERVQNLPMLWDAFKETRFEETEKLDGTSFTCYKFAGKIGVCSRNVELEINEENLRDNLYVKYAQDSGILKWLRENEAFDNIAIQGELVGHGVQGNHYKLSYQRLFLFDIFDIKKQKYMSPHRRGYIYSLMKRDGVDISHVPVTQPTIKILQKYGDMESLLKHADGKSELGDMIREGFVYKAVEGELSFKVVSNEFLLGEK